MSTTRREFLTASLAGGALAAAAVAAEAPAHERAGQREHARKLHRESTVVILHDLNPLPGDIKHMIAGGVTAKVYHIGVDVDMVMDYQKSGRERENWSSRAFKTLDEVDQALRDHPEQLMLATTAEDVLRAKQTGKLAILLGVEGGKLLEGKLEMLGKFYQRGLRQLQLRWAVPNQIVEVQNLTPFGRDVVKECDRLGMIISLSHIPTPAFHEVVELAEKPPIVCHGAAARTPDRLVDHMGTRQLKALAQRQGVLGIHFYSTYLRPPLTVKRVVEQVDLIAEVAGIDTVALGIDFFPTEGKWGDLQRAQGTKQIAWAIPNLSHLPEVTDALVNAGYSDADVKKVLGENYLRVCRAVFGK